MNYAPIFEFRYEKYTVGIPVAGARGQGKVGPRWKGGRHRNTPGQDFARKIKKFKIVFGLRAKRKMIRGDPYLVTAASRPKAVLSSANFVKSTARGGGVPVAGGGWTMQAGGTCS